MSKIQKNPSTSDANVEGTTEDALNLEAFLPYRLLIATNLVSKMFEIRYRNEFGISIPESRILNVLSQYAPISSWEICERTALTKPSVSTAISRLAAAGLLTRDVDQIDKRLLVINLTEEGRALQRRIVPEALAMERAITDAIGRKGSSTLIDLLGEIERTARDHLDTGNGATEPKRRR